MEMTGEGLMPVDRPGALFLADRRAGAAGSVVGRSDGGRRPLCVEVQALVVPTGAVAAAVAQALRGGRLAMLLRCCNSGRSRARQARVYASVAGGVRVARARRRPRGRTRDRACGATPVAPDTVVIGEVGLGGEIRQVPQAPRRLAEACGSDSASGRPASTPDVAGHTLVRVDDSPRRWRGWPRARGSLDRFRPGGSVGAEADRKFRLIVRPDARRPGTPLREGIDRILQAKMGALIVVGDGPRCLNICSGGFLLDAEFTPQRLSELAKMDGAIILASDGTRVARANVHLVPDPDIPDDRDGTRHRTAERVARQIAVPVITVSEEMSMVVTVHPKAMKQTLEPIPRVKQHQLNQ